MGQSLSTLRWRRSARSLQELAARPAAIRDLSPNLSCEILISALENVAKYTSAKNQDITLVVVGGIINTIFLRSRPETHDVDFFNDNLPPATLRCLSKAAKSAFKRNRILGRGWLNNHVVLFVPSHVRRILLDEALEQHEVVFQAPGLTLLAAPWEFLFCTKLHRLSGRGVSTATSYDQEDAVHYLEKYISLQSTAAVAQGTVRFWFGQYLLDWTTETEELLPGVNSMYQTTFHVEHDPIILSS
ncbi:hypothetical protein CBS147333_1285 [Penicillium roqueforti]|nr:hypothetical protein CBS147333_1285 [Penicillium roqueforti]KAI3212752.1 hypothetical protein CBS147311_325 [Penicillium roqueforti]KAI3276852.1 hypothetical protein CBS147308_1489 [Penicillium roqueforti]KAI3294993.1 hypothetical protein DTO002I6_4365 [Penicillium roqueforti]KAI3297837.1 hypothetical protein DTO003C3_439 [Penicillium roqueforti]